MNQERIRCGSTDGFTIVRRRVNQDTGFDFAGNRWACRLADIIGPQALRIRDARRTQTWNKATFCLNTRLGFLGWKTKRRNPQSPLAKSASFCRRRNKGVVKDSDVGDEEAAASLGVPVFALKLKIFIISGVLSALAGILYAFVYTPSYLGPEEFGLMLSVTLVTMVVIGGMGSIWGGLAGAVFMTSLHEIITLIGEKMGLTDIARFEQLLYGILLVLVLIFCPQGLAPGLNRGVRRLFQNLLSLRTR